MSEEQNTDNEGFHGLGLADKLLGAIDRLGFVEPTPIQKKAIPDGIAGRDIIGLAQTGTGKTLAFGLPMIQRIAREKGTGLVVLPTRELAEQADAMLKEIAGPLGLRTAVLIGGASMSRQMEMLAREPHVIIGTPGRIIDHLERKTVSFDRLKVLVLDEADRMLDMGFMPQIRKILRQVPKDRQTLLFSATMPAPIARLTDRFMRDPIRIEAPRAGKAADKVFQELYVVEKQDKLRLLEHLLSQHEGTALVFSRTKHGARDIRHMVETMGHSVAEIHADRSLAQRREALEGFKKGKYRVLVATDIAARGIDVTDIAIVVNYDIPENAEDYVHRIGRTGRAGQEGHAITFAMPDQGHLVTAIEMEAHVMLPISPLPEGLPPARRVPRAARRQSRGGPRRGGPGRGGARGPRRPRR